MHGEYSQLSDLVANLRKRCGLSQQELARRTGYSRWTFGNYEHGKANINIGFVAYLAQTVIAQQQERGRYQAGEEQRLLAEVNAAIIPSYGRDRCFTSWDDLCRVATAWPRRKSKDHVELAAVAPISDVPFGPSLHQLRAATPDFVGRTVAIAQLTRALTIRSESTAVVSICGIRGMGGVGKTELAYRVAQEVIARFPDGQLLLELRGTTPQALSPEQALQTVIRTFAPQVELPDTLAELRAHYRTLLHKKRALILADDARDAAQVCELAPPPGSALLITSRWHFPLPGMIDAHVVDLSTLEEDEAVTLLHYLCPSIGEQAPRLAALCGYLPLALRIAAGRLANEATLLVNRYLEQLRDERTRLGALDDVEAATQGVEAVLGLSYAALDTSSQSVCAQLSVFPASFARAAIPAVVVLVDEPSEPGMALDRTLAALCRASLLDYDVAQDRFRMHDLIRCFAAAQLTSTESVHLRHAACYAYFTRHIREVALKGGPSLLGALAMFDAERTHIDVGRRWAMQHPPNAVVDGVLINYLMGFAPLSKLRLDVRHDYLPFYQAALAAARRQAQPDIACVALSNIGFAYSALGDEQQARTYYEQALTQAHNLGIQVFDPVLLHNLATSAIRLGKLDKGIKYAEQIRTISQANANQVGLLHAAMILGWVARLIGAPTRAVEQYQEALQLARMVGNLQAEQQVLVNLANVYANMAQVDPGCPESQRAIAYGQEALAIAERLGDGFGQATAWSVLGNACTLTWQPQRAIGYYEQALAVFRAIGDQHHEAVLLGNLGNAYQLLGDFHRAEVWYEQAIVQSHAIGDSWGTAKVRWCLGVLLVHRRDLPRAVELMRKVVAFEQQINHPNAARHAYELSRVEIWLAAQSEG